jgi:hypothetical protein
VIDGMPWRTYRLVVATVLRTEVQRYHPERRVERAVLAKLADAFARRIAVEWAAFDREEFLHMCGLADVEGTDENPG